MKALGTVPTLWPIGWQRMSIAELNVAIRQMRQRVTAADTCIRWNELAQACDEQGLSLRSERTSVLDVRWTIWGDLALACDGERRDQEARNA